MTSRIPASGSVPMRSRRSVFATGHVSSQRKPSSGAPKRAPTLVRRGLHVPTGAARLTQSERSMGTNSMTPLLLTRADL